MSEILIYRTEGNKAQVEVKFDDETVWFTQRQKALLFVRNVQSKVTLHNLAIIFLLVIA